MSKKNLTASWQEVSTESCQIQNKTSGDVLIGQGAAAPTNDGDAMVLASGVQTPFSPKAGENVYAKMAHSSTGSIVVLDFKV